MLRICGIIGFALAAAVARADDWTPAKGPLATRWAKDVAPEKVHPEYPRPQMVRADWRNLNGLWQFAVASAGEQPPIGKQLAGKILAPFPVESALSGVMRRAERLWYRRTFEIPAAWAGQHVLLHFGAVDWEANVYLNGKRLGDHRGGYDAFSFDITDAVTKDGPQELVVGVFDPSRSGTQPRGKQVNKPGGIYYTPSTGIWQTVWIEPVAAAHIESLRLTPDVDAGRLRVVAQGAGPTSGQKVLVVVLDGGREVGRQTGNVGQSIDVPLSKAKLWSPVEPFLYDVDVRLLAGEKIVDKVRSYVGFRKIEVSRDENGTPRIHLNGKPIFLTGPLDQGFWPDGLYTAPSDEALRYDIEMTKKLGFNMTRKHVKVEPERWYYWCDKLGLLVWQDMPSGDRNVRNGEGEITRTAESARQFELELNRMIEGLANHPSIMMWVLFNEGWGQYDTVRLAAALKKLDPTRLVDCASGWNDMPVGDVIDRHQYPGPGAPPKQQERASVLGEFGGLALGVDGHTWAKKTWGYRETASRDELSSRYIDLMGQAWKLRKSAGLCAAVYTQITDVETEANGLMTYDREVLKVDLNRVAEANRGGAE
jgi:beta-galactosidase/beta-glucuronidase